MPHSTALDQWIAEVSSHFKHLGPSFVETLSLYAFGMATMRHCGQTVVSEYLSQLLGLKFYTMRQRLRELTYEAEVKRGQQRQELVVATYFAAILGWLLTKFSSTQRQLILAIDATHLSNRFIVLSVSVVIYGSAIPVAWHIQKADQKGAWNPIWCRLLAAVQPAVPALWEVSVLADSGIYSKPLFNYISQTLAWHPHLRINPQGLCRDANGVWIPLASLATQGMTPCLYTVICFKSKPLPCTLLVEWDADYEHPCLVVTDLPASQATHLTYHLRYWIEAGFKDMKRGGLRWEQTKIVDPARMERLWLVMSLALVCLFMQEPPLAVDTIVRTDTYTRLKPPRLSCLWRGWIAWFLRLTTDRPASPRVAFAYPDAFLPNFSHDTYP